MSTAEYADDNVLSRVAKTNYYDGSTAYRLPEAIDESPFVHFDFDNETNAANAAGEFAEINETSPALLVDPAVRSTVK